MSHIAKIELEVNDIHTLKRACARLGVTFQENKQTFVWYYGENKCAHAIQVPGANYEIGVIQQNGKFELQTDWYDRRLAKVLGENGGLLKQAYAVERTRTEAIRKGYRVIEKQTEAGIRLHVRMG